MQNTTIDISAAQSLGEIGSLAVATALPATLSGMVAFACVETGDVALIDVPAFVPTTLDAATRQQHLSAVSSEVLRFFADRSSIDFGYFNEQITLAAKVLAELTGDRFALYLVGDQDAQRLIVKATSAAEFEDALARDIETLIADFHAAHQPKIVLP